MAIKCVVGKAPATKPSVCIDLRDTGKGSIEVVLVDGTTKCVVASVLKIGKKTAKVTRSKNIPTKYGFDLDSYGRVKVVN
jgi:hypothetical protein